jgi:hypothetical protein
VARAEHGDEADAHVTLCLKCSFAANQSLLGKLGDIFAAMFGSHEHLDIVFLREAQERELRLVCAPFYRAN